VVFGVLYDGFSGCGLNLRLYHWSVMSKIIGFSVLIFLLCSAVAHPLKMCVCDVKHLPESQQLALKFKFFWDDLEATLEKRAKSRFKNPVRANPTGAE
jgi:hypothetical protein